LLCGGSLGRWGNDGRARARARASASPCEHASAHPRANAHAHARANASANASASAISTHHLDDDSHPLGFFRFLVWQERFFRLFEFSFFQRGFQRQRFLWFRSQLWIQGFRLFGLLFADLVVAPPCSSVVLLLLGRRWRRSRCDGRQEAQEEDHQEEAGASASGSASASCGASCASRGTGGRAVVARSPSSDAACDYVIAYPLVFYGRCPSNNSIRSSNDHRDADDVRVRNGSPCDDNLCSTFLRNNGLHHGLRTRNCDRRDRLIVRSRV